MTDTDIEQRAKWLALADTSGCLVVADKHGISRVVCEGETFAALCAAVARQAQIEALERVALWHDTVRNSHDLNAERFASTGNDGDAADADAVAFEHKISAEVIRDQIAKLNDQPHD